MRPGVRDGLARSERDSVFADECGMPPPLCQNPRYHALDHFRGLLCAFVVLEHAGVALWEGATATSAGVEGFVRHWLLAPLHWNIGTPLFFVISGYCIAASVDSTRRKGVSPWAFLGRRLWRIFPPYWCALLVFVVVVAALDALGLSSLRKHGYGLEFASLGELSARNWLGNALLIETWRPHVISGEAIIFTRIAWSLCFQEQFYLVCFAILLFAPRRLYGAWLAVTLASIFLMVAAWDAGANHRISGFFPRLWHEFAIGLGVYWMLNCTTNRRARTLVILGILTLFVVGFAAGLRSTLAASVFGLAMIVVRRWDLRVHAANWLEPLRACGRRSFSIYLIHLPVCTVGAGWLTQIGLTDFWTRLFIVVPAISAASLAAGWLFHHGIDVWFHQPPNLHALKARLKATRPAPVAALAAAPAAS